VLLIIVILILVGAFSYSQGYKAGSTAGVSPGQTVEDPAHYVVYVVVSGHRDGTPLHLDHSANIHVDSVSVYYTSPGSLPSGGNWAGFGKSISVTLQITGESLSSSLVSSFTVQKVALGASWGQALTFTLPPGTYTVTALGTDQGGYQSSASTTVTLP
jgi:hypothetical protein